MVTVMLILLMLIYDFRNNVIVMNKEANVTDHEELCLSVLMHVPGWLVWLVTSEDQCYECNFCKQ